MDKNFMNSITGKVYVLLQLVGTIMGCMRSICSVQMYKSTWFSLDEISQICRGFVKTEVPFFHQRIHQQQEHLKEQKMEMRSEYQFLESAARQAEQSKEQLSTAVRRMCAAGLVVTVAWDSRTCQLGIPEEKIDEYVLNKSQEGLRKLNQERRPRDYSWKGQNSIRKLFSGLGVDSKLMERQIQQTSAHLTSQVYTLCIVFSGISCKELPTNCRRAVELICKEYNPR